MKTITYPQCEGCGKTIEKPSQGYTVVGGIYTGFASPENEDVIVGGWEEPEKNGDMPPKVTAWCQNCLITKLVEHLDEMAKGLPSKQPEPLQTPKE